MKLAVALVSLSASVMVIMIVQTVRQELTLRSLKTRISEGSVEVKKKEGAIVEVKAKIHEFKKSLIALDTKMEGLKKQKTEADNADQEVENRLRTCNNQKEEAKKKSSDIKESMAAIKAEHEAAKTKAQQDIQSLKQQILDRDKAICAFADTTKEEARKLCGIAA
ncbi:WEB family protein At1g12150 [Stegastes partitus]|uniref:WEB family protein At1g12150-like n=1 Tax=Stegastes partitus TaxID=144197 RepID=A0A3B4ZR49_9TELE|nr:PREDICTED: WEB family protein At1g12150-like [Stegastes partitus]